MTTKLDEMAEDWCRKTGEVLYLSSQNGKRVEAVGKASVAVAFVCGFKKAIEEAKNYASGSSGHTYDHFMQIIKHLESFTEEEHERD